MEKILKNPSEYVESRNYFSWERFFTALLIEETKGTYLAYFKRNLNPVYLNESIKTAIFTQMKKIKIERKNNDFLQKNIPQRYRDYHINRDALGGYFSQ